MMNLTFDHTHLLGLLLTGISDCFCMNCKQDEWNMENSIGIPTKIYVNFQFLTDYLKSSDDFLFNQNNNGDNTNK